MSFPETLSTLPQTGHLSVPVGLVLTRKAYRDILREKILLSSILTELTDLKSWRISPGTGDFLTLHLSSGELSLKVAVPVCLVISYTKRTQKTIRRLLGAHEIRLCAGIDILVKLPKENQSFSIIDHRKCPCWHFRQDRYIGATKRILEILSGLNTKAGPQFSTELEDLLRTAKNYTVLEGALYEKNTAQNGPFYYSCFRADDYREGDRTGYIFTCAPSSTPLSPGNYVTIFDKNELNHLAEITQIEEDGHYSHCHLLFMDQIDKNSLPKSGVFYLSSSDVIYATRLRAIETFRKNPDRFQKLSALLEGTPFKRDATDVETPEYFNERQKEAFLGGLSDIPLYLVLGPPGTGKTAIICAWAECLVREGKRVLITSQNNKAVDNVLERLESLGLNTLRIGSSSRVDPAVRPLLFEYKCQSLRQQIAETVSERIQELEKYLEWVHTAIGTIKEHLDLLKAYKEDCQAFITRVATRIKPKIERLGDLREDYEKEVKRIRQLKDDLSEAQKLYEKECYFPGKKLKQALRLKKVRREIKNAEKYLIEKREDYQNHLRNYEEELDHTYILYENLREVISSLDPVLRPIRSVPQYGQIQILPLYRRFLEDRDYAGLLDYLNTSARDLEGILSTLRTYSLSIKKFQNYGLEEQILSEAQVIGATCNGVLSQERFRHLHYDVCIIDEAGQILLPDALIPMCVSDHTIMVGDYNQIPPQVDFDLKRLCERNRQDPTLLKQSLFEYLFHMLPDSCKTGLNIQYRMPSEIADTVKQAFYEDLRSPGSKRDNFSLFPGLFKKPFVIIDTSEHPLRHESREDQSLYNRLEVDVIYSLVKSLTDLLDPDETGIISAYGSQINRLRARLTSDPEILPEACIATLDSFQGQERDLIVYSFVRSSHKKEEERRIGFLSELRRLNVAMTRTKKTLVLIGDMTFLSNCRYRDDEIDEAAFSGFMRQVCSNVKAIGDYVTVSEFMERLDSLSEYETR